MSLAGRVQPVTNIKKTSKRFTPTLKTNLNKKLPTKSGR